MTEEIVIYSIDNDDDLYIEVYSFPDMVRMPMVIELDTDTLRIKRYDTWINDNGHAIIKIRNRNDEDMELEMIEENRPFVVRHTLTGDIHVCLEKTKD